MSTFHPLTPDQVTIAVTVYNRRQYVKRAVASALNQTQPAARVIVVEDCGPDATLQDYVKGEFGDRIEYIRNPKRRGLFDNWNACVDYCRTPWLSILHDDDYLAPNCVESIVALARQQAGCALYYGHFKVVDEAGNFRPDLGVPAISSATQQITLRDVYRSTPIAFAGTVFAIDAVRAVGGFNPHSQFAGDWQMWANLIARHGAAATRDHISYVLGHYGSERGSTVVMRSGKAHALNYVQRKRVVALMRQRGMEPIEIDRREEQALTPVSIKLLLDYGASMSPRLLRYNLKLLTLSRSLNWRYAVGKAVLDAVGVRGVRAASRLWNNTREKQRE